MKNLILALMVVLSLTRVYANESITWTPTANQTQIGRFEWFEAKGRISTVGFADTYKNGSTFGKGRVFYSASKSLSAGAEVRFSSWGDTQVYCAPQASFKIGKGGFSSVRYWMKSGFTPDWGTYTCFPLGKKLWLDASWNLDSKGKTLLFEPQVGLDINKNWSVTLQHRCGSIWPTPETVVGVRLKF